MKLVDQLNQRIAELEGALENAASRFEDVARVMREDPAYYNPGFYEWSAARCRNVLAGRRWNDIPEGRVSSERE